MSILTKGYSIGSQVYGGIESLGNLYDQFFGAKEELGRRAKLDEFITNSTFDFSRTSHFRLKILPASINTSGTGTFNNTFASNALHGVSMLCDSTTLPDVATIPLSGAVASDFSYEVVKNVAYATQSASFYVHEDMFQKKFFDDWIELTYHKSKGQPHYYNNYVTDIEIYQLKRTLDSSKLTEDTDWTYKTKLYNVYPKSIAPMTLDWGTANQLQKISVTFHYTHWDSFTNK